MKRNRVPKTPGRNNDDLLPEYRINYRKARPNRFAERFGKDSVAVVLDPDVSRVFRTAESVNAALRSIVGRKLESKSPIA